jgi:glyoxylase-like metal-dependent hydrolase (beta-lactamase superfamily II)
VLLIGITCLAARAQTSPMLPENSATRVSDHVYAIMGFPNVAIVLGSHATLVVDTGMGPKNGAVVVRQAQRLAQTQRIYLTTTHFHPEHAAGLQAFPAGTVLIRPAAQQEEMDRHVMEFIQMFRSRSEINRTLLEDVVLHTADITFDHEVKIDLGSVTVRLFWLGPAHTRGDELIFVEPDEALISGDVVQSKIVPNMPSTDAERAELDLHPRPDRRSAPPLCRAGSWGAGRCLANPAGTRVSHGPSKPRARTEEPGPNGGGCGETGDRRTAKEILRLDGI